MNKTNKTNLLFIVMPLLLASCGGTDVKQTLGIGTRAPDEFRVVARPPLSVPPEFELLPPSNGEEVLSGTPASEKAKTMVLGPDGSTTVTLPMAQEGVPTGVNTAVQPVIASPVASTADEQFLQNAGAAAASSSIRDTLKQDQQAIYERQEKNEEGWFSSIWSPPKPKEPVVDAKKEAERIEENKTEGKPVTEGETALKKTKDRGLLGDLFN